jgi:hypothetical protein
MKRQADPDRVAIQVRRRSAELPNQLKADCKTCCGLCCVALPFDASQGFGFDKSAHTPCALLRADDRCSIHDSLVVSGFPGCAAYDCYGAGQWVTQHYFQGVSWRDSPQSASQMFDVFRRVRALHELMAMLTLAMAYVHDREPLDELRGRLGELQALCSEETGALNGVDIVAERHRVVKLLQSVSNSHLTTKLANTRASALPPRSH